MRVFLSYRRNHAETATHFLYERLAAEFGAANVFRDVDTLHPGENYLDRIVESIGMSDAVLVVIGRSWADVPGASGRRRLDDPRDVLRVEIETALRGSCLVVPVLVENGTMPTPDELPGALVSLALLHAAEVGPKSFGSDVDRLLGSLRRSAVTARPVQPATPPRSWPSPGPALSEWRPESATDVPAAGAGPHRPGARSQPASIHLDDGSGRSLVLPIGSTVIGRGQDSGLRLPDTGVNRQHLRVDWDGTTATLSDLGSTNGTTVNGFPVAVWQLADGDHIRIGHTMLVYRQGS